MRSWHEKNADATDQKFAACTVETCAYLRGRVGEIKKLQGVVNAHNSDSVKRDLKESVDTLRKIIHLQDQVRELQAALLEARQTLLKSTLTAQAGRSESSLVEEVLEFIFQYYPNELQSAAARVARE